MPVLNKYARKLGRKKGKKMASRDVGDKTEKDYLEYLGLTERPSALDILSQTEGPHIPLDYEKGKREWLQFQSLLNPNAEDRYVEAHRRKIGKEKDPTGYSSPYLLDSEEEENLRKEFREKTSKSDKKKKNLLASTNDEMAMKEAIRQRQEEPSEELKQVNMLVNKTAVESAMAKMNFKMKAQEYINSTVQLQQFQQNRPQILAQKTMEISAIRANQSKKILGSAPTRTSDISGGSIGAFIFGLAANVASGGSYLQGLKEAYAREKLEEEQEAKRIARYLTLSKAEDDAMAGENAFLMDGMKMIGTALELQEKINPGPEQQMKMEQHNAEMEKIRAETALAIEKKNKVEAETDTEQKNRQLEQDKAIREREALDSKLAVDQANIKLKNAQALKTVAEYKEASKQSLNLGPDVYVDENTSKPLFKIGLKSEANVLKANDQLAGIENLTPALKTVTRIAKKFQKSDLTALGNRIRALKAKTEDEFSPSMLSKEDQNLLIDMKTLEVNLNQFFAKAKEALGLGRLSDWDAMFIRSHIGAGGTPTSPKYFSFTNLEKMLISTNDIYKNDINNAYRTAAPLNVEGTKRLSKSEFLKSIGATSEKKAPPKKVMKTQKKIIRRPPPNKAIDYLQGMVRGQ